MPLVGFEPTISAGDRPQTYALNHATIGTGNYAIKITGKVSKNYEALISVLFSVYLLLQQWYDQNLVSLDFTMSQSFPFPILTAYFPTFRIHIIPSAHSVWVFRLPTFYSGGPGFEYRPILNCTNYVRAFWQSV